MYVCRLAIHVGSVGKSTGNDRVIVASDNDLFEYCDNHITVDTSDTSEIKGKALRHHPSTDHSFSFFFHLRQYQAADQIKSVSLSGRLLIIYASELNLGRYVGSQCGVPPLGRHDERQVRSCQTAKPVLH